MKSTASLNIAKLFESEQIIDYKSWKKQRTELASKLGPNLLTFNELELAALFASWESEIKDRSANDIAENRMSCLLIISLYLFFRPSFDSIKKFSPIIIHNFIGSMDRNICRISVHTLKYLMDESPDNATFLRETLDLVKTYFLPNNRKKFLFNSLFILKEVGRFLPNDVFGITLSHLPEIWDAALSADEEICEIALKVIDIHIQHVPSHTAENFATSLYIDCTNELNNISTNGNNNSINSIQNQNQNQNQNQQNNNYYGPIMVCLSIYKNGYPNVMKIGSLIERLISIALMKIPKVTETVFHFLVFLAKAKDINYNNELMNHSIMVLVSLILERDHTSTRKIFLLRELISYVPPNSIPASSIVEMIQFLTSPQKWKIERNNITFGVLVTLLTIHPNSIVLPQVYYDAHPCKNYIKALLLANIKITEIKDKLFLFCENSFKNSQNRLNDHSNNINNFQYNPSICNGSNLNNNYNNNTSSNNIINNFSNNNLMNSCNNTDSIVNTIYNEKDQMTALRILKHFVGIIYEDFDLLFQKIQHFSFSQNIKIRWLFASALSAIGTEQAKKELIRMAAYDNSKEVRVCCLRELQAPLSSSLITSLLTDKSFKVRREVIPLISETAKIDPIGTVSKIILFTNGFIASNLLSQGPYWSAKTCSLLPSIAKHFIQFSESIVKPIAFVCVSFLLHGDEFAESQNDLRLAVHRDFVGAKSFNQPSEDSFKNLNKNSHTDTILSRIYQIENEKWIEKRDVSLFEALGFLSQSVLPFISQIIPVYIKAFTMKHRKSVYLAALNSLTKIVMSTEAKVNILAMFPGLLPALMRLIGNSNCSEDVAIGVLKLTGTMGATSSVIVSNFENDDKAVQHLFAIKNPSYFATFVLGNLTSMLSKEASPSVFDAITNVFVYETSFSLPFLKPVLIGFIDAIEMANAEDEHHQIKLFNQLELIMYHSKTHVVPFLGILTPFLKKYIADINGVRIATTLSYFLSTEFIGTSSQLFPASLHYFDTPEFAYFKALIKFITFSIMFQLQSIDLYMDAIEGKINILDAQKQSLVLKSLSSLVQANSVGLYTSRIGQLCFDLLKNSPKSVDYLSQLILNLLSYSDLSFDAVERLCQFYNFKLDHLEEIQKQLTKSNENCCFNNKSSIFTQFVRKIPVEIVPIHLSYLSATISTATTAKTTFYANNSAVLNSNKPKNPFKNPLPQPVFNNARQWIEDICIRVVSNSPSFSIQSCSQIINQSQSFRQDLFPIAFFSCWKNASTDEKKEVSNIVQMILEKFEKKEPELIHLAEFLDRCGHPFLISDLVLAQSSETTAFSLFYLQRYLLNENPMNENAIESLLKLNSQMGRIESARGLLTSVSKLINQDEAGKWSEELGEWEKALEIYENSLKNPNINENIVCNKDNYNCEDKNTNKNNDNDSNCDSNNICGCLLRCYSHLELWNKIREKTNLFDLMNESEKAENAIWFAWAFYHSHEFDKVQTFINYIKTNGNRNDPFNSILFQSLFLITSNNFKEAEKSIIGGFKELTRDLNVFSGSDANKASKNMVFAQHLIELQEVLNMKQSLGPKEVPNMWQHRLQNFSHESDAWTKLVEIRSLILSPEDHMEAYLKMLSVLRKERRWRLIDAYCDRFFSEKMTTALLISRLKIMWARGSKNRAASIMEKMNYLLNANTNEEKDGILNSVDPNDRPYLVNLIPSDSTNCTLGDREKAQMLRLQANWQYQLQKKNFEALKKICIVFEKSVSLISDDYRTWAGWAYASSAALKSADSNTNITSGTYSDSNLNSDSDSKSNNIVHLFALNAISGFLKAAQLKEDDSLEYLCQMFSIFFRYGEESFELPPNLLSEIISLPPSIIVQIIPQIVVHIAHKGTSVRQIVSEIIEKFGSDHFQAVIYPLNVLSLIKDEEKAHTAQNLIKKLGLKHPKVYSDVALFIDGMHRSAVSLIEQCIAALDASSHSFRKNDRNTIIEILSSMYDLIEKPCCEMDLEFLSAFKTSIQRIRSVFDKYRKGDNSYARQLWDSLRIFFGELEEKIKKIDSIQLSKISEKLAKKESFEIVIPGTYKVNGISPQLSSIDPLLSVMSTQQHPRTVVLNDRDGKSWKFLLKGNEDLRLDQRIMQLFTLINSLLMKNRITSDQTVSIVLYAIVPFAPNAGLISWVTGADTFQQLVNDFRAHRDIKKTMETDLSVQMIGSNFNALNSLQKYEVYLNVSKLTKANELREILWLRSPTPSAWLQRNRNFTISTALMSIAGYVIGLGDRHPSNIMIQRHTGHVIHIDFGDSFDVALNRKNFAERVPFRMTRMIVNALDGSSVEGLFRKCCEDVLWALRENQSSVTTQLEVFVHEPIFSGKDTKVISGSKGEKAIGILDRVMMKLSGKDPLRIGQGNENDLTELEADEQVDRLIKIASDPKEYIRHYAGWCPFW